MDRSARSPHRDGPQHALNMGLGRGGFAARSSQPARCGARQSPGAWPGCDQQRLGAEPGRQPRMRPAVGGAAGSRRTDLSRAGLPGCCRVLAPQRQGTRAAMHRTGFAQPARRTSVHARSAAQPSRSSRPASARRTPNSDISSPFGRVCRPASSLGGLRRALSPRYPPPATAEPRRRGRVPGHGPALR